jgi:hypothetical protein
MARNPKVFFDIAFNNGPGAGFKDTVAYEYTWLALP